MIAVLGYALARLRAHPGRAALAAVGIAATAAIVAAGSTLALSLGHGFDRAAARAHLPDVIALFDDAPGAAVASRVGALPNVRAQALRYRAENVSVAVPGHANYSGVAEGVEPGPRGYAVVAGHDLRAPDEVLVERGLAREWRIGIGNLVAVGGRLFRVVGTAVEPDTVAFPLVNQPRVFVEAAQARAIAGASRGSTNEALLWAARPAALDLTLAQARSASYGLRDLRFLTRSGIHAVIGEAAGIVIALLVAVSVVTLAVAAAILAASAASEVQRRLQAIGVLRALGASPRDVVAGHVVEAALVAAPAAAVGVAAGAAAVVPKTADLLVSLNELPPAASTLLALLAAVWLGTVAVVGAAAAVPAARAVRRPPVAAMRGADVAAAPVRAPLPAGAGGLGIRLALARPLRTATAVVVLAAGASFALLILGLASLLTRLQTEPQAIGRSYQLELVADRADLPSIRRAPGVASAALRYETWASDAFDLGESFQVVAFDADHTRYEAPPLAQGRRARGGREAEVGVGLAQALDLHPGATLAAVLENGREARFRVVGLVRAIPRQGRIAYVGARPLLAADPSLTPTVAVRAAPGGTARAQRALARFGQAYTASGGAGADAVQGWAERNSALVDVLVALLRAIAVLDGIVCAYALVQVLALTAAERARSIALVRALGGSPRQVRRLLAASALAIVAVACPLAVAAEQLVLAPAVGRLAASYASIAPLADATEVAAVAAALVAASVAAAFVVERRSGRSPVSAALADA